MIRVGLVYENRLSRLGIRKLLEPVPGLEIACEAGTARAALKAIARARPDVTLLSETLPGPGSVEVARRVLARGSTRLIMMCPTETSPWPSALLAMGVAGLLTGSSSAEELIAAIRAVHRGRRFVAADLAQRLAVEWGNGGDGSPLSLLSRRELQVLQLLARGQSPTSISEQLSLSPKTISTYRYRICCKLGTRTDFDLFRVAACYGLIDATRPAGVPTPSGR